MKECLINYRCDFCNNIIGNTEKLNSYKIGECNLDGEVDNKSIRQIEICDTCLMNIKMLREEAIDTAQQFYFREE